MKITRQRVAQKLIDYLQHRITLTELADWAELVMMEADFEEGDFETLRDIVGRLYLADVRAFGMTWEDCEHFLSQLGYRASVMVSKTPVMVPASG
ncbi:MAG: hypothetical protein H8E47_00340 [Anaerolineales bacterium]|nr:hypothetical protein [Anaerolineales bacterium]